MDIIAVARQLTATLLIAKRRWLHSKKVGKGDEGGWLALKEVAQWILLGMVLGGLMAATVFNIWELLR